MALIYIADLEIADSVGTPVTLRFSTKKTITVVGNVYTAKITQPAFVAQSISFDQGIGGAIQSTVGELTLTNSKRDLDYLKDYIVEGKLLTLKTFDTVSLVVTTVLTKKIEQLVFEWRTVSVRLQDSFINLDTPLQTQKYLGNNIVGGILTDGFEGVVDLKDKPKPLLFGRVANVSAVQVNSQLLVYQISTNPIEMVINVLTNGAYITPMVSMPGTLALFKSTVPSPGFYTFWTDSTGTYIRLGFPPETLTVSVIGKLDPQLNSPAAVIKQVLTYAGYTSANWVEADFTYLDTKIAANVGLEVGETENIASVLTSVCQSIGAWWGFDGNNIFRLYYFDSLTGTPIISLYNVANSTEINQLGITSVEIQNAIYNGKPHIVSQVVLNYDKNWEVIDNTNIAGIVPTDRVNWLKEEWRKVKVINSSIVSLYPTNQVIEYETLLNSEISATAEANRVLTLLSSKHFMLNISVKLTKENLQLLTVTSLVKVYIPRYGMNTGRNFIITSVEVNYELSTANLSLWG